MKAARKYEVEGPIGSQLNKKQYSKMLQQMDAAMQKALIQKKHSKIRKRKSVVKSASVSR